MDRQKLVGALQGKVVCLHVFASPFSRTVETAERVCKAASIGKERLQVGLGPKTNDLTAQMLI